MMARDIKHALCKGIGNSTLEDLVWENLKNLRRVPERLLTRSAVDRR